jgi:hypothetical protein
MGERVEWAMEFLQQRQLLLKHGRLSNHVRSAREGCKGPIIQRVMKADWWCFKMPWQCNWRHERKIVQDVLQKVAGLPLDHLMIKIWPRVRDEHHYLLSCPESRDPSRRGSHRLRHGVRRTLAPSSPSPGWQWGSISRST